MPRTVVQMELAVAVRPAGNALMRRAVWAATRSGCGSHGAFRDLWRVVRGYLPEPHVLRVADGRCRLAYRSVVVGLPGTGRAARTVCVVPLPGLGHVQEPDARHGLTWFCPARPHTDPDQRAAFALPTTPPTALTLTAIAAAAKDRDDIGRQSSTPRRLMPESVGQPYCFTCAFDAALPVQAARVKPGADVFPHGSDLYVRATSTAATVVDVARTSRSVTVTAAAPGQGPNPAKRQRTKQRC